MQIGRVFHKGGFSDLGSIACAIRFIVSSLTYKNLSKKRPLTDFLCIRTLVFFRKLNSNMFKEGKPSTHYGIFPTG